MERKAFTTIDYTKTLSEINISLSLLHDVIKIINDYSKPTVCEQCGNKYYFNVDITEYDIEELNFLEIPIAISKKICGKCISCSIDMTFGMMEQLPMGRRKCDYKD